MKKISTKYFILDKNETSKPKEGIKFVLNCAKAFYYKLRMNMIRVESTPKQYKVSVCAIFKNEAPYLKEWIEFNRIVGVEHFYLYNNNSEDNYEEIIAPYIKKGLVTLVQWPKNQAQMECYNDCISRYSEQTQWLGFIDIDEFIVPIEKNSIYEILQPFEKNRGAVKLYWKMFGTSGLLERNLDTLVTEKFSVSWPKYYSVGKCFYNTNFDFDGTFKENNCLHHLFWANYRGLNIPPVNVQDKVCFEYYDCTKGNTHSMQLNHYFTKSFKEYGTKKAKGDVYFEINPHDEEYFYLHEMENTSVDCSAYKFLIKLKLAMRETI